MSVMIYDVITNNAFLAGTWLAYVGYYKGRQGKMRRFLYDEKIFLTGVAGAC